MEGGTLAGPRFVLKLLGINSGIQNYWKTTKVAMSYVEVSMMSIEINNLISLDESLKRKAREYNRELAKHKMRELKVSEETIEEELKNERGYTKSYDQGIKDSIKVFEEILE